MRISRKLFATTCAGSLAIMLAVPAEFSFAQDNSTSNAPAASAAPMQSGSVDDVTLQKAAKAYVQVKKITHNEKTTNDTSANKVAQAEADKLQAVRSQGLEPDQYNQVIQLVEADTNLQQKFMNYVNQNGGDTD
ncbi:MAG TPA: DUF4168 domain-containing protein [Candidatus Binataceae bacterium]|nr:DUF4168 domain-containing protein [Candidatus Binataceae bacterium]